MMASFLLKSKNRAPVMEAPDLLVPGNTAKDCQTPMIKASFFVISESLRRLAFLSDVKSSIANRTTRLLFGNNGLIKEHRDYFDFCGPTFGPVPILGPFIRWLYSKFVS